MSERSSISPLSQISQEKNRGESSLSPKIPFEVDFQTSFEFGGIKVNPNVFLSPMHGVSDQAFRLLLQDISAKRCGLLVSEFVAMESLRQGGKLERRQMRFSEMERPFGIQIFGADPVEMERGAQIVLDQNPDFIELNCGCPAPKVVKRGGGSSLLTDIPRLTDIVKRIRRISNIPFSVKVRLGWDENQINVLEVLKICEQEGVDLFIIHGRTRQQGYGGNADWKWMQKAVQQSSIPIVGNGDILTVDDVKERLKKTGVHGVSIGRGALHNPWIFNQVADAWQKGYYQHPTADDQFYLFKRYNELLIETGYEEIRCLGRLKQLAARLTKCFPVLHDARPVLLRTKEVNAFLDTLNNSLHDVESSPFISDLENLNGQKEM